MMADLADIENALVSLIAAPLYAGAAYLPGAYQTSATGTTTKLYRGWPESANLTADLIAGYAHVSVFAEQGMTRNVSRWMGGPVQVATVAPTITATASGATVTIGGTVTAGNVVGIQAGAPLAAHAYIVQASDTLATIATALATKISGASATGAVITLPTTLYVSASVMTPQPVMTVTRQQTQGVKVSVWAPSPSVRDATAGLIDNALSGLKNASGFLTRFFAVGSYEVAKLAYRASYTNDLPSRDRVWRRDLCFTIEYQTTLLEQDPMMLFGGGTETINPTATARQIGATQAS